MHKPAAGFGIIADMKAQIALLLAAAALAAAADDSVSRERYPDADAVVVSDITRIEYAPDGTYVETCENRTKVMTEKGRREERTVTLSYSRRYGEASIDSVSVVGTNGVERAVDVSATTKEATDNGSMAANIYDPLDRRIVCTVSDLAVGETLCVKTTRRALKPRCRDQWSDLQLLELTRPIVSARVEVRAPKERPIRRKAVRHPLGNVVATETPLPDGGVLHVFAATNSPQAFAEPDMPPLYTQVQHVRVSTAADWPEVSRWYWDLCAPHLAKTNAAMAAKVGELMERGTGNGERGTENRERLVRRIFKFVSQEVRYMGLTMEDTSPGYAPHDVDVTFDNRYGVCRDKAGLLVAMLRLAGFRAFPVLINVGAKLDPEVPQPFFNHAIVAVETGERQYLLMDPTNENAKDLLPAYESDKSYLVCRPEGDVLRTTPTPSPEHNALKATTKGTLSRDGSLVLESEVAFGGVNDTAYRAVLARMTGDDRVKFFDGMVRTMAAGAELLSASVEPADMRDTESPVRVRLAARVPEALLRGDTRCRLDVPFVSKALGVANFLVAGNTSLETRRFPLALDSTASVDETVEVDLGGAASVALEMPPEERVDGALSFGMSFDYAASNGVLRARRRLAVSKVELSPEEYAAARETIKRVEAAERRRPVFAVDPVADADVRWIDRDTEVDVLSDSAWTAVERVEKEVLTYQGKRSSAELKFSYNPLVEDFRLVSAVVSNRDGRVMSVAPHEINVMDCGWAASAPRYPASKTLVVNLPGVEVGSVISYETVRSVTNAPAPFYAAFGFDSKEPLVRRRVRVNDWTREVVSPRRVPDEPAQPDAALWRDRVVVSSERFERVDLRVGSLETPQFPKGTPVREIRDWMSRCVKVVGPGMYELPLALQLTDPRKVLEERYATRLDYVRTLCALLRGAGHEADVVLAADNADEPAALRARDMFVNPNVRAFSAALCRVRERKGGFLGFGETVTDTFVGVESKYAPLGATAYVGSDYFDPASGEFGTVSVPSADLAHRSHETQTYALRDDGTADLDVVSTVWGIGAEQFRKTFDEILPEERTRLHQELLGSISTAATATSGLEADIAGYPAVQRFSCLVPDIAVVGDGAMSVELLPLVSNLPSIAGSARRTPFVVGATLETSQDVVVRFPKGYVVADHLPDGFDFADPSDPQRPWLRCRVDSAVVDGALEVRIRRDVARRTESVLPPDALELVRGRLRIASSRANCTVVAVRRADD